MASEYINKIRTKDGAKQINYNALANLPNLADVATSGSFTDLSDKPISTYKVDENGTLYITEIVSEDLKGADGYTPVKGVDYWTEEDKAEIKAYVDEAILGGAW